MPGPAAAPGEDDALVDLDADGVPGASDPRPVPAAGPGAAGRVGRSRSRRRGLRLVAGAAAALVALGAWSGHRAREQDERAERAAAARAPVPVELEVLRARPAPQDLLPEAVLYAPGAAWEGSRLVADTGPGRAWAAQDARGRVCLVLVLDPPDEATAVGCEDAARFARAGTAATAPYRGGTLHALLLPDGARPPEREADYTAVASNLFVRLEGVTASGSAAPA